MQAEEYPRVDEFPFYVPGLDVRRGLELFEGETEDYISALQSFVRNAPNTVAAMRGVTEGKLAEYEINAHGLKSICGYICAENVRTVAYELELLAKAGDFSGVSERNDGFLDDLGSFIEKLGAALEEYSG